MTRGGLIASPNGTEMVELSGPSGQVTLASIAALGAGAKVVVTLTAAQIADLHDNPVVLAPAPGASKAYQVLGLIFSYHWNTTGFESTDGRFLVGARAAVMNDFAVWETDPPGTDPGGGADFLNFGPDPDFLVDGSAVVELRMNGQNAIVPPDLLDNEPLVIGNPNTDFAGGDGTLTLTVTYTTFDL